MSKRFRPGNLGESRLISKIASTTEHERRRSIISVSDHLEPLSNAIAMKLIESELVETNNKRTLQEQIEYCLEKLTRAEDFDIDYQIAPIRMLVPNPHIVSLYVTAFVIEHLVKHKDIIDVYGSDEEIYACVHRPVIDHLSR